MVRSLAASWPRGLPLTWAECCGRGRREAGKEVAEKEKNKSGIWMMVPLHFDIRRPWKVVEEDGKIETGRFGKRQ